eukprot:scaffold78230_cov61-Attheya_sp.AAC.5
MVAPKKSVLNRMLEVGTEYSTMGVVRRKPMYTGTRTLYSHHPSICPSLKGECSSSDSKGALH